MDVAAALAELEAAGTEQSRNVYRRHGAPEPLFGVPPGDLRGLAERIGADHALALGLWASGNTDARCLATLVADPARVDAALADAWSSDARYFVLSDLVAELVARTPLAIERMSQWVASSDEWIGRAGWSVMGELARRHPDVPDAAFTPYLAIIERRIHDAPNRTRETMNEALIAVGARSDELAAPAIAAAERIGAVAIDHGASGRTTADAVAAIRKARSGVRVRGGARRGHGPARPTAAAAAKATGKKVVKRAVRPTKKPARPAAKPTRASKPTARPKPATTKTAARPGARRGGRKPARR